jgi:hypothetical protein
MRKGLTCSDHELQNRLKPLSFHGLSQNQFSLVLKINRFSVETKANY